MGKYVHTSGDIEKGKLLACNSNGKSVELCREKPNKGCGGVFSTISGGSYYFRIVGFDSPMKFTTETVFDIVERQLNANCLEYNWINEYLTPATDERVSPCPVCGEVEKDISELKSNQVNLDRPIYTDEVIYSAYELVSKRYVTALDYWHEDCILAELNPLFNQATRMCAEEEVLNMLYWNEKVDPELIVQ